MQKIDQKLAALLGIFFVNAHCCQLPDAAYEKKAEQVISATLALNQGFPNDLRKFCVQRQVDLQKFRRGGLHPIEAAEKRIEILCLGGIDHRVLFRTDKSCSARFLWAFGKASQELFDLRIQFILQAYCSSLPGFELPYNDQLQNLSAKTFSEELDELDIDDKIAMVIEEAAHLAARILKKYSARL